MPSSIWQLGCQAEKLSSSRLAVSVNLLFAQNITKLLQWSVSDMGVTRFYFVIFSGRLLQYFCGVLSL